MMRAEVLPEPELEFGSGLRHIDVRFGLMSYGPVDVGRFAGAGIPMGIVGTSESISGLRGWLDTIDRGVAGAASKHPNFHPRFPGMSGEGAFRCGLEFTDRATRTLSAREVRALTGDAAGDAATRIRRFVDMIVEELRYLASEVSPPPQVTLIALPVEAMALVSAAPAAGGGESASAPIPALHDLLKARAMQERRVIQVVWPRTWNPSLARGMKKDPSRPRSLQDEATRAWNLTTALYYKAGGTPWRLVRRNTALQSLHVGVRFFRSLDGEHLNTSLAQVFDERGDGTVIRGGAAKFDKEDRQAHLDAPTATDLLRSALAAYRGEHKTLPARVVLHKSSGFNDAELDGFRDAASKAHVEILDLVSIGLPKARLFRPGVLDPLRGTLLSTGSRHHVLYSRGSVPLWGMYPGSYVPTPLGITCADVEGAPREIAEEILALTKMNWNNTQFDGKQPITLRAAIQVSDVLRYIEPGQRVEGQYRYYM